MLAIICPVRVLVAPDKFKGTMTAAEVAAAIAAGIPGDVDLCPIADGGEGTADVIAALDGGEWVRARATDPLGREVECRYLLTRGGEEAVIEVAEASGLWRLDPAGLDALAASSAGTGELIADAIGRGARRVTLACGGSATTDGGTGALSRFDPHALEELVCLVDTDVAFASAAEVYGPQKGADAEQVGQLRARLEALAAELPHDPRRLPFTGAAGGLSGGFWAYGARLVPGARAILDRLGFDERLRAAAIMITGEGRLDATSLRGKAVGEALRRARAAGVPCHAIVGSLDPEFDVASAGMASVTVAGAPRVIAEAAAAISSA